MRDRIFSYFVPGTLALALALGSFGCGGGAAADTTSDSVNANSGAEGGSAGVNSDEDTLGQLGYGNTEDVGAGYDSLSVSEVGDVDFGADITAVQVSVGATHTCALLSTGGVRCWGDGMAALGTGDRVNVGDGVGPSVAEVGDIDFGPGVTATQVSAGATHSCALLSTGGVSCWGRGVLGYDNALNVGDGEGPSVAEAGEIDFGPGVTATRLDVGSDSSCALLSTTGLRCWGSGYFGGLGCGDNVNVGDGVGLDVADAGDIQF